MEGKAHSAQSLTIGLLRMLPPWKREALYNRLSNRQMENKTRKQMQLCMLLAGEPEQVVDKYHRDIGSLAKTILARQTGKKTCEITQSDVGEAMGFNKSSALKLIARIQNMERELSFQEIEKLCDGFQDVSTRNFWKNQIYALFPEITTPNVTQGPELDCLQMVWDCLEMETQKTARLTYLPQKVWFDQLDLMPWQDKTDSNGLYDLLDKARKNAQKSKEDILAVLNMDKETYRSYKRLWTSYEEQGCRGAYPRNRLSRERLLFLAVYLDLDFYTAAAMLAMGGYAFRTGEPDKTVVEYLINRSHTKQAVLEHLHPTMK